jgi:hypothetical protein
MLITCATEAAFTQEAQFVSFAQFVAKKSDCSKDQLVEKIRVGLICKCSFKH